MLKKTIAFVDYNGAEQSEDVYFNLSKSELTKLEMRESTIKGETVTGGLRARIEKVMDGGSGREIIDLVEMVIRESVGIRTEDGKRFEKSADISKDFMNSAAYDALFMELVTDADAAAKFINAVLPADIASQIEDQEFATHKERLQEVQRTPDESHPAELTEEERAMLEKLQKKAEG